MRLHIMKWYVYVPHLFDKLMGINGYDIYDIAKRCFTVT